MLSVASFLLFVIVFFRENHRRILMQERNAIVHGQAAQKFPLCGADLLHEQRTADLIVQEVSLV